MRNPSHFNRYAPEWSGGTTWKDRAQRCICPIALSIECGTLHQFARFIYDGR